MKRAKSAKGPFSSAIRDSSSANFSVGSGPAIDPLLAPRLLESLPLRQVAAPCNQPIIGQRSGVVRRSKTSRAGRARLGSRRYSASRSSARIRCDSGTGTCSAFERELNPVGSAGTGGCVARLRLRGREAMPSLYAPGYFVSTCSEGYSRSARAAEEGIALCQEVRDLGLKWSPHGPVDAFLEALQAMLEHRPVDLLQHVETHLHLTSF